ncbi:MAG: hypothetical protein KGI06_05635 [Candidatus Micrarchaeota archaeon]|nr:hypothetical protein [Candidatus Micrarchaeota archaeon]
MNTIIAVPLDEELASYIGKKGSENSITFYNRKLASNNIVGLMPTSIEEKFHALPQALLLADQIVVSTRSIDKLFGEVLVAAALLNKRTIFTKDSDISNILSGITLENIAFADRENLLDLISSFKKDAANAGAGRVDIDKAFNVMGVGTVALGIVTRGTIKVHDSLQHSSGKAAIVRSIQSQDEDVKEATAGTRVGLALKGMDAAEMQKGDILSSKQVKPAKLLELEVKGSGFVKEPVEEGKMYSIAVGFSYSAATVEKAGGNRVAVRLEKALPVEEGDAFMLVRALSPRIFASGRIAKLDYS